ncbi:MAG: IclR family transcriptional regulator [Candidatus Rokubacteria bacterium]|nr:IclR family transcriptional regulator [Candidatus Rokubacteria bacterium]
MPMLKRTLDLLGFLAYSAEGGAGLAELSRAVRAPKSSVFKIVSTLEAEGFISRNRLTDKYQLTLKLLALGTAAVERINLRRELYPFLKELKDRTGECVNLGILHDGKAIYVESLEGPGPVKVIVQPGQELSLHSTALGKVLLANLPASEIDRLLAGKRLEAHTPRTCTNVARLKNELAQVRRQGYALDVEEDALDMTCAGAPIRDHTGGVVAAVSVTAPRYRMSRVMLRATASAVVEAAERMSRWLGCGGGEGQPGTRRART